MLGALINDLHQAHSGRMTLVPSFKVRAENRELGPE